MDQVYILNLKAKDLLEPYVIDTDDIKSRYKLYDCTLPYSLEIKKLLEIAPTEFNENVSRSGKTKMYTDLLVNVSFDDNLVVYSDNETYEFYEITKSGKLHNVVTKKKEQITNKTTLRSLLYSNGFTIVFGGTAVTYSKYKRSASKSRDGSHLFIMDNYRDSMLNWSWLGMAYIADAKEQPFSNNYTATTKVVDEFGGAEGS